MALMCCNDRGVIGQRSNRRFFQSAFRKPLSWSSPTCRCTRVSGVLLSGIELVLVLVLLPYSFIVFFDFGGMIFIWSNYLSSQCPYVEMTSALVSSVLFQLQSYDKKARPPSVESKKLWFKTADGCKIMGK